MTQSLLTPVDSVKELTKQSLEELRTTSFSILLETALILLNRTIDSDARDGFTSSKIPKGDIFNRKLPPSVMESLEAAFILEVENNGFFILSQTGPLKEEYYTVRWNVPPFNTKNKTHYKILEIDGVPGNYEMLGISDNYNMQIHLIDTDEIKVVPRNRVKCEVLI